MTDTSHDGDVELAAWALAVIEEALVRVGIGIHERDVPDQLDVDLTFRVTADRETGRLVVRSPGSRGRSIRVGVPVPPTAV